MNDYTQILNNIYLKLSDILSAFNSVNFSMIYEIIIVILFFILILNIERGYYKKVVSVVISKIC